MSHKTAKPRTLFFGPAAQAILKPYLLRPEDAYLFSPAESARKRREERSQQRQTPLSCGNTPGSNLKDEPQRRPGPRYTTEAYGHAIYFACEQAFAMPGHYLPNAADQVRPEDGPEQIERKNHRRRLRTSCVPAGISAMAGIRTNCDTPPRRCSEKPSGPRRRRSSWATAPWS